MDKAFIQKCITEALTEVYKLQKALTDKQSEFVKLSLKKIFQEETKVKPEPKRESVLGDVYYECNICGKKCSSAAGLTLHKKRHDGKK